MSKAILRYAFNNALWSPNKPEWLKAMSCIQNEERYRISGKAFQRDAKSAIIGRLMIRKVITELLNIGNSEVRLERSEKGRPFLITSGLPHSSTDLDFNISHQGNYTLLTAGYGVKTGVDVMKVEAPVSKSVHDFFHIMRRQFHEKEWVEINKGNSDMEKMRLFYRHWCLKESYVKALGIGIGVDLDHFVCSLSHNSEPWVYWLDQDNSRWKFEEHSLDDDHVAAVAWFGDNVKEGIRYSKFIELTFPDLLVNMSTLHRAESEFWTNYKTKEPVPPYLKSQANQNEVTKI